MNAVFVSYSHAAENRVGSRKWKRQLLEHLAVFTRHGLIEAWDDEKIPGGWRWEREIERAIRGAQLAIVLLTNEALESEFIQQKELTQLSRREIEGTLTAIPILCEPCSWQSHPWLQKIQIRPFDAMPLSTLSDRDCDMALRRLATEIARELSRIVLNSFTRSPHLGDEKPQTVARTYLDRFRLTRSSRQPTELIGREQELALLDLVFSQRRTAVLSLVAWAGVGKTMLTQIWLARLQRANWFDLGRVYAWSFYSQGTNEDRQASEDLFLINALEWFGVQYDPAAPPWEKGRLLGDAMNQERTLLVLDGIEPLQYPPGPLGGKLRAPGLQSLLRRLVTTRDGQVSGLCVVTTREPLPDLTAFEPHQLEMSPRAIQVELGNLTEDAGAALLHQAGARFAGAAELLPDDAELCTVSRELDGHALTLNLLGRFLHRAHRGDVRRRDLVKFETADSNIQGGHTFRMLSAFENWFSAGGDFGMRRLCILRLLGLFDRPAEADCMAALRRPPALEGLTSALFVSRHATADGFDSVVPIMEEGFDETVSFLAEFGLLTKMADLPGNEGYAQSLDCHPLIREYFAKRASATYPETWRRAHERLFEQLKDSASTGPKPSLVELQPLYHALHHACLAARFEEARRLYYREMLKGADEHYSWFRLGAFGADLQLLAGFFERRWDRPFDGVPERVKNWLFGEVGYCLRCLGRIEEAYIPLGKGASARAASGDWIDAATVSRNLCEVALVLGLLPEASDSAEQSLEMSKHCDSKLPYIESLAALGHVRHQQGMRAEAVKLFDLAVNASMPPQPLIFGVSCFQSHDLLLTWPERGAVRVSLGFLLSQPESEEHRICNELLSICETVSGYCEQSLKVAERAGFPIVSALAFLTAGRVALYQSLLFPGKSDRFARAQLAAKHLMEAERMLSLSSMIEFVPALLLTRSWLRSSLGDRAGACADLNEAWQIAERSEMRLHMADIHLYRARLFFTAEPYPWSRGGRRAEDDIEDATELIENCSYWRRKEELRETEAAIDRWNS